MTPPSPFYSYCTLKGGFILKNCIKYNEQAGAEQVNLVLVFLNYSEIQSCRRPLQMELIDR